MLILLGLVERFNTTGNSECFNVLYAKGTDIGSNQNTATLMPSNDYAGGLWSTVKSVLAVPVLM